MASKPKPYARLELSEEFLQLLRSAQNLQRKTVFENWKKATDEAEKKYYSDLLDKCDDLGKILEAPLTADKSQDAPDDEDEEEEQD